MLVDNENRACLADFGFAGACTPFRVAGASSSSDVGGTAGYMAPELFLHRSNENLSTPKGPVDVYALGMLIYEVFSRVIYSAMTGAQHSGRCSPGNSPFMLSTTK